MKYVFIINPKSGSRDHSQIVKNIHSYMSINNHEYEIHFTNCPGDATKIAMDYIEEKNIVIYSVGGDGTLNEIVNAIANTKVKLGIIPAGSGNDFYRSLINSTKKNLTIDLGKVNDKYFINIASIGIDAEIANNVILFKKLRFPRKSIYNAGIIYTFFQYKYKNLNIKYNKENYNSKNLIIAVCNGMYYGGGYKIAPLASFDDNYFDVYFAEKISKIKIPGLISLLKKSQHESSDKIRKERLKEITISCDEEMICNYDGEILKAKELVFKMVRDSINIYNDSEIVNYIIKK